MSTSLTAKTSATTTSPSSTPAGLKAIINRRETAAATLSKAIRHML